MKVSLITTVKNEAATSAELIRSIRGQSRPPDEWLVVDGGSTDGTPEVFAAEELVTLINEEGNIAHGRNVAIERASGSVIAVIDGGCAAEPDWLERLVGVLETGEFDFAAGSTVPRIDGPLDAVQWILLDQFSHQRWGLRTPAISSRSLAFMRPAWEWCRYPEWLDHSEDAWLFERWRQGGLRVVRESDARVQWRLRPTLIEWVRQQHRYMRGQGQAALHTRRHLTRVLFYAALLTLIIGGLIQPWLLVVAATAWGAYAAANLVRFPGATAGRSFSFKMATLAWLPVMLLTMDVAKIVGYLNGRLARSLRPE
jgi:glycosyltransferase involved in cell wall biosynthesis